MVRRFATTARGFEIGQKIEFRDGHGQRVDLVVLAVMPTRSIDAHIPWPIEGALKPAKRTGTERESGKRASGKVENGNRRRAKSLK